MKKVAIIFILISILLAFSACGKDKEAVYTESSTDIEVVAKKEDAINSQGAISLYTDIKNAFDKSDMESFSKLLVNQRLNIVSLYGGMGIVEVVSSKESALLQIKDGLLLTKDDPEVDPPEQEVGISSNMFSSKLTISENDNKEGLLEKVDWEDADYDFLASHIHTIYGQLVWLCDEESSDHGWTIYKLSNNTYLFTNGYCWYSDEWDARVFMGQSFVVKNDNGNYKIAAFIDIK